MKINLNCSIQIIIFRSLISHRTEIILFFSNHRCETHKKHKIYIVIQSNNLFEDTSKNAFQYLFFHSYHIENHNMKERFSSSTNFFNLSNQIHLLKEGN